MNDLSLVYTRWYVLSVLAGRLGDDEAAEITYAIYGGPGLVDDDATPDRSQQLQALNQLQSDGIIRYNQESNRGTPVARILNGSDRGIITQERYYVVVPDTKTLRSAFAHVEALKQQEDGRQPVVMTYDTFSGTGTIDGREFSVTRKNKKLFEELYRANRQRTEWVAQADVLRAVGLKRDKVDRKVDTLNFNTAIGNLRRTIGLSKHQLQVKNGAARIYGNITDIIRN